MRALDGLGGEGDGGGDGEVVLERLGLGDEGLEVGEELLAGVLGRWAGPTMTLGGSRGVASDMLPVWLLGPTRGRVWAWAKESTRRRGKNRIRTSEMIVALEGGSGKMMGDMAMEDPPFAHAKPVQAIAVRKHLLHLPRRCRHSV